MDYFHRESKQRAEAAAANEEQRYLMRDISPPTTSIASNNDYDV